MVVLKVIVDSVLEHFAGACQTCVFDLRARNVKVTAALKSFKNELNVDRSFGTSLDDYVVVHFYKREGSLHALDLQQLVRYL